MPSDIAALPAVFHFDNYPRVSEVYATARAFAARHAPLSGLRQVGRSRHGTEILLLSVGPGAAEGRGGDRNVLVVGGPHANERVGGATVLALAELAVRMRTLRARADVCWHFLLCLDPDGTRLNEIGPSRPPTLLDYHRPFFRPAGPEQPEWAPSLRPPGDELPETRALLDVIHRTRPFLQCSLHANDVGGSWVQLTRDIPGLAEPFAKSAAELGIPLEFGSVDTLYWEPSGSGVFVVPSPGARERFPSFSEDVARSTWSTPHRYGGVTVAVEAPMWVSWAVADETPQDQPRRAVSRRTARLRGRGRRVTALLAEARPYLPGGYPGDALARGAEAAATACSALADDCDRMPLREDAPPAAGRTPDGADHPIVPVLTAGHLASLDTVSQRIPLRAAAMLRSALEDAQGQPAAGLRRELDRLVTDWCTAYEAEFPTRWVPVEDQVRHQARTVLAAFERLV